MLRALIFLPLFFHLGEAQSLNPVDQELVEASLQGDLETIKEIISNHKLTKDAEKNPKIRWEDAVTTPLHLAAGNGHLDIVKFYQEALEEDISHISSPMANVTTPLHCALINLQLNVLEFYLDFYEEAKFLQNLLNLFRSKIDEMLMRELYFELPNLKAELPLFEYIQLFFTMLSDLKLFTTAMNTHTSNCTGLRALPGLPKITCVPSLDNRSFQLKLTTPSLPIHLPHYIRNVLIERTSSDTEFHWHLDVTCMAEDCDIQTKMFLFFWFGNERMKLLFKNEILWGNNVKVTEFEDGAQFDWTVRLSSLPMAYAPGLHIKLRIVLDNEPKVYFSKLVRKPEFISSRSDLFDLRYLSEFSCFEMIKSTIL